MCRTMQIGVAAAGLALLAALASVPSPARAEAGGPVRLAQFEDPSAPIAPPRQRRARQRDDRDKPDVPPFAPPTAPITSAPAAPADKKTGGPGGSEIPPYDKELTRLSEVLGALHYLRGLCGANEGQLWRDRMEALIAADSPTETWHGRLVASFNAGYRSYAQTYRRCTPSARRAVDRYLAEGRDLTQQIKTRYAD